MVSKLVVTLMMRPQPFLRIGATAKRVIRNAPMALIVTMRCQPSGSASKNVTRGRVRRRRHRHADAGAVDQNVERAERVHGEMHGTLAIGALRDVAGRLHELAAEHRLGGEPLEAIGVDVDTGDLRTGTGQCAHHHPAHAARRAGHHRDPAREHWLFCHCCLPFARADDDRSPPLIQLRAGCGIDARCGVAIHPLSFRGAP